MMNTWKKIDQKQFSPIYLLYGKERFLINETKQKILNNVLKEEELDFNFSQYDLDEVPIEVALADAETIPFMSDKRLIIVHHPRFLTTEKTNIKVEHDLKAFERYIQNPPAHCILVIIANYDKLDERKKLTKLLKKHATVIEAKKMNEKDIKTWLQKQAADKDLHIGQEAMDHLLLLIGTNLMMLQSEMDKLALYARDTKQIDTETVEKLTSRSLEQSVFSLVDKVVQREIAQAFRIYYDLLKQNEEPIKMLAIIASQFRLIYQTKELLKRGYSQKQIASYLKVHPFRVKLAAKQAGRFSEIELSHIIDLLAEGDYKMKTGKIPKEMVIEMFLFSLK